jgi:hypothetical protein
MHTMRKHPSSTVRMACGIAVLVIASGAPFFATASSAGAVVRPAVAAMNTCPSALTQTTSPDARLTIGPNTSATWNAIVGEDLAITLRSGCAPTLTATSQPAGIVRVLSTDRTSAGIVALRVQAIHRGTATLTIAGSNHSPIILGVIVHRAAATFGPVSGLGPVPATLLEQSESNLTLVAQHLRTPISEKAALRIAIAHPPVTGTPDGISLAADTIGGADDSTSSTLVFIVSFHATAIPPSMGGPVHTPGGPTTTTEPDASQDPTVTYAEVEIDALSGEVIGGGYGVTG